MFAVNFGFNVPLIEFFSDSNFGGVNQLDKLTIDGMTLKNLMYYSPAVANVPVLNLGVETPVAELSNLVIQDVDIVLGLTALIKLTNYGTLTLDGAIVSNVNVNAYNYDTTNYAYIGNVGAMFEFNNMAKSTSYSDFTYNIKNVKFSNVYAQKGGGFFLGSTSGITSYHITNVNFDTVTVSSCHSNQAGMIFFYTGDFKATVTSSAFENNIGIANEADLRIEKSW